MASGIFKGIKRKRAEKIVETLGEDCLIKITLDLSVLNEVKGIPKESIETIQESLLRNLSLQNIIMKLNEWGISLRVAKKIHKAYGNGAIRRIEENPYILANNISGISFKKSDSIAENLDIKETNEIRIKGAIEYALNTIYNKVGSTWAIDKYIVEKTVEILYEVDGIIVDSKIIYDQLEELTKFDIEDNENFISDLGQVRKVGKRIYLEKYYMYEKSISDKICSLNAVTAFFEDDDTASETEFEDKTSDLDGDFPSGQRGLSSKSNTASVQPKLREDLLGIEDYFTYEESSFGNASAAVNVTTGNMAVQFTDESLYTRSDLGYAFTRTYNSRSTKSSVLGKGWTFVGNETLTEQANGDVEYADGDGTVHLFKKSGDTFTSPKGLYEQLKKVNNTYTMTDKDASIQTYQVSPTTGMYAIASYTDAYQNEIAFKRNSSGQVIEVAETKGTSNQEKIKISYVDDHISQVQYGDHWTKYSYTNDQLTQTIIGSNKSTRTIVESFMYDANGQLTKYVDGQKKETTFKYNANELIIFDKQTTDAELSVTNTYQFDAKNNEYKSIDSSDNETVYKREEKNNTYVVVEEDAPGDDEQQTTSFYTYDEQYNLLETINPDATTEKNTYDTQGNLLISSIRENTVTNTYNKQNQLTLTEDVNGEETTYTYDGPSLISSKVEEEEITYAYDTYGRVIKTMYANGTFEQIDYDDEQRQVTSTDKKGNTTSVVYSIYGQKVKETDADGHTKSYTYDPVYPSKILSVTDGNGHKTAYQYDNNNNLTTLTDALNRQKTYTYNDNDQETAVTMPNMKFSYEYDENGEISKSKLPSGVETTYTYNSDGQLAQIQNGNEAIAYTYDKNGNTTSILRDTKTLKTYGYTAENNLLANYTLGLFKQDYGYDEKERNNAVTTAYGEDFKVKETTTFKDNSDDVDHIQLSIGEQVLHNYQSDVDVAKNNSTLTLNTDLWKQVTQMNDANWLESLNYTTKTQQPFKIAYDYTKSGNIAQADVNGQVSSFVYDANDQLTKETLPDGTVNTYEYDEVGNRKASDVNGETAAFTYNEANQIATKNGTAYTYDADGNLLQDENYKYTYNEQQRLTTVATLAGQTIATYTYDENGLRLTKTIGDTTHEYFYTNEVLDMEVLKVKDTVTEYRSYKWSGYTPLSMIVKAKNDAGTFDTKAYQFITNHRGDVLSIRDSEDKEVATYTYDAYGNELSATGDLAKANPIRYAGYYFDEETKNYYLQARYYNPANGSFLALDPHPGDDDEPLSQNGYSYANGNPVMNVDPNGKLAWWITSALVGAALNALPMVLKYYYKHRTLRGFNWWVFGRAAAVGAITSIGGAGLYRAVASIGGSVITRVIALAGYGPKAYILNTIAKGKKPTLSGLYSSYITSGVASGLNVFKRLKSIYRYGGKKAVTRYIKSIR